MGKKNETCRANVGCESTTRTGCKPIPEIANGDKDDDIGCADGYTGTCSASCSGGNLLVNNRCKAICTKVTIAHCKLSQDGVYGSNEYNGTCVSGYSGYCSYRCDSNRNWYKIGNTCRNKCIKTTINDCKISQDANLNDVVTGTCNNGGTGTCSYRCQEGFNWTQVRNTCGTNPCIGKTIDHCSTQNAINGGTAGACIIGYTGSCSYRCSNAHWDKITNSCTIDPSQWCVVRGTNSYKGLQIGFDDLVYVDDGTLFANVLSSIAPCSGGVFNAWECKGNNIWQCIIR